MNRIESTINLLVLKAKASVNSLLMTKTLYRLPFGTVGLSVKTCKEILPKNLDNQLV